jgi:hypothetical protein
MRKTIIAAVAAIAIAPWVSAPAASANPCGPAGSNAFVNNEACGQCEVTAANYATCFDPPAAAQQAPKQAPNGPDNCAAALAPPNPSPGAYNGCETARQARAAP